MAYQENYLRNRINDEEGITVAEQKRAIKYLAKLQDMNPFPVWEREETPETDLTLTRWLEEERQHGLVDEIKLPVIENARGMTPEQALDYVRGLANKLQAMLPYDGEAYVESDITKWQNDDGSKMTAEDIIGKDRDRERTIHVSRTARAGYGGNVERQKRHAEEHEASIISLSPSENLERLLQIAKGVWNAEENKSKTDDEKKRAVFAAIEAADYGYARTFQQQPVRVAVLISVVLDDAQVYVFGSCVGIVRVGGVGAVEEKFNS
jgi:hypothetical protein